MRGAVHISARHIASAHTILALTAFVSALILGCLFHYKKIVKNGVAGFPEEYFPSVSATIGDWYPERSVFQLFIAMTSGPRFALVYLQYVLHQNVAVFITGIIRTLSCGGWVYITSSDDHDAHDVFMITYIICNLPWMIGTYRLTPTTAGARKAKNRRFWIATAFFGSLIPLVYFFIQHKVYRVPGAYTHYAFFEWTLIFLDVIFDSVVGYDFEEAGMEVVLRLDSTTSYPISRPAKDETPAEPTAVSIEERPQAPIPSNGSWSTPISFAADIIVSYLFWSAFTSIIPTLFYFSIWELGIAGHELAVLSYLTPYLFGLFPSSFFSFVKSRKGQNILDSSALLGLYLGYLVPTPFVRLLLVTPATIAAFLSQVSRWASGNASYHAFVTALGLLAHSLSKHVNYSVNPLSPFADKDSWAVSLGAVVIVMLALNQRAYRPFSDTFPPNARASPSVLAALPLGSLIYTLYSSLADPSTLIAYSWTGFGPTTGPHPHTHSPLTLFFQSLGLFLPTILPPGVFTHPLWFAFGTLSWWGVYTYQDWPGYLAGLCSAVYFMSIIPSTFKLVNVGYNGVAKTFGAAMFVMLILTLANIWTVAYAFVPGGPYLRERSDLVMITQMALLIPLYLPSGRSASSDSPGTGHATYKRFTRVALALIVISSMLTSLFRLPPLIKPYHSSARIMRAGIWTVHFGLDNTGRDSQRRMKTLIEDMELDVVGLLETDLHRTVYGSRDLTRYMVEQMGFHVDIGPTGPKSHTWGAVLLSKFPILNSTHHLLPSPDGELAPAIEAVLDVHGTAVTVVVSHNGQEETPLDRTLQSIGLAKIMSAAVSAGRPVVYLGYVVTQPHAPRPNPYEILVTDGQVHDIDDEDHDRWCEYILYRGLHRTSYARLSRGVVTDTELQIGQFVVPLSGTKINETRPARYLRAWKEEMPVDHWFPMSYYEELGGKNDHFYHVFGTPLYYKIPEYNQILAEAGL